MFSGIFKTYFFLIQYTIFYQKYSLVLAMFGNVREARENEFPAVVSIIRMNNSSQLRIEQYHKCTATLISRQDVLTAEHCLRNTFREGFKILAGSRDLREAIAYYPVFVWTYENWILYRQMTLNLTKHDIAIIKLIGRIPESIQFAPIGNIEAELLYGLDATIAGWGKSLNNTKPRILHTATVRILSNTECEQRYYMLEGIVVHTDQRRICTAGTPYAVLYKGDSGGPLFFFGTLVAVNRAVSPEGPTSPYQTNIHLGLRYYYEYIQDILNNFNLNM